MALDFIDFFFLRKRLDFSSSREQVEQLAGARQMDTDPNFGVFVTDQWRGVVRKYTARVVKELDKMIDNECSIEEKSLWHLFREFDTNHDCVFDKAEMDKLFRNLDPDCTPATLDVYEEALTQSAKRTNVNFVDLCRGWQHVLTGRNVDPSLRALAVARAARDKAKGYSLDMIVKSSKDAAYDAAAPSVLEALLGHYRELLGEFRQWHMENRVEEARQLTGSECAKKMYEVVRDMLSEDEKVLWEVFCEHDTSLNGRLDRDEMKRLLVELDSSVSPQRIDEQYRAKKNLTLS